MRRKSEQWVYVRYDNLFQLRRAHYYGPFDRHISRQSSPTRPGCHFYQGRVVFFRYLPCPPRHNLT